MHVCQFSHTNLFQTNSHPDTDLGPYQAPTASSNSVIITVPEYPDSPPTHAVVSFLDLANEFVGVNLARLVQEHLGEGTKNGAGNIGRGSET